MGTVLLPTFDETPFNDGSSAVAPTPTMPSAQSEGFDRASSRSRDDVVEDDAVPARGSSRPPMRCPCTRSLTAPRRRQPDRGAGPSSAPRAVPAMLGAGGGRTWLATSTTTATALTSASSVAGLRHAVTSGGRRHGPVDDPHRDRCCSWACRAASRRPGGVDPRRRRHRRPGATARRLPPRWPSWPAVRLLAGFLLAVLPGQVAARRSRAGRAAQSE